MRFQLTRSRGARPACSIIRSKSYTISTHALTWSATLTSKPLAAAQAFQLTRSRGARPVGTFGWQREHYISTHALTWSATKRFSIRLRRDSEFQLTRSRGARPSLYSSPSSCISNFNSRAHVERDAFGLLLLFVSALFQLTRSRGARRNKRRLHSRPTTRFQLTRSRGARREGLLDEIIDQLDFNSRAHVERDSFVRHLRVYFLVISTHALTWSATKNWRKSQWKKSISTHALTWSATNEQPAADVQEVISTHALTWSATLKELRQKRKLNMISTHALTWSATPPPSCVVITFNISTHALTWSATKIVLLMTQF